MLQKYADIIIDISHEAIDRTFQYRIPADLVPTVKVGMVVRIPFGIGNHLRTGYVVGISDEPQIDASRMKEIASVASDTIAVEGELISLAYWMKEHYGSTMTNALKTVMPVKKVIQNKEERFVKLEVDQQTAEDWLAIYQKKHAMARYRIVEILMRQPCIKIHDLKQQMTVSTSTLNGMIKDGILSVDADIAFRNPVSDEKEANYVIPLNTQQEKCVQAFVSDWNRGDRETYLLHGITGSGKTEVYMSCIEHVIANGLQVIVLIPEIALTYQTVKRYQRRFGNRVTILNSRMSDGERYDQFLRMKAGAVDVVIGPRSALFAPFCNLGLIIIDEEHENAYKSEYPPRYHARETALQRAKVNHASVILGSATPSVDSYQKAVNGEYKLWTLSMRAVEASSLPQIDIVDLREELRHGNKSIFSGLLMKRMQDCLSRHEQMMIFINRRGYESAYSCRNCGITMQCPHCDIALTFHKTDNRLHCHYCGYETEAVKQCPSCHSKLIAPFRIGTQKIVEVLQNMFPQASVDRMDYDTTRKKDSYREIMERFANRKIDILVGTQMIVKGHDYANVTLVGILAADLSLHSADYRSGERTFQLLVQAAGRAGRGEKKGYVVIQSYQPQHYSITCAAKQDYESFYQEEIAYRSLMNYPPAGHMLHILFSGKEEEKVITFTEAVQQYIMSMKVKRLQCIGPVKAVHAKVNDYYRQVIYLKTPEYETLVAIKNTLEEKMNYDCNEISVLYDFDPMNTY